MLQDTLLFIVTIFVTTLFLAAFAVIFSGTNDVLQTFTEAPPEVLQVVDDMNTNLPGQSDYTVLFLYMAFVIVSIAGSWFIPSNPLYYLVFTLLVFFFGLISMYLANSFYEFTQEGILSSTLSQMPISSYILNNYLFFAIIPVILMTIVFFIKPTDDGGYY